MDVSGKSCLCNQTELRIILLGWIFELVEIDFFFPVRLMKALPELQSIDYHFILYDYYDIRGHIPLLFFSW